MENNGTVLKNIELDATSEKVWEALTNPELTKQYFFDCECISTYEVGSPIAFVKRTENKDIVYVKGRITVCLKNKMLAYTCYTPQTENTPDKHTLVTMALIPEKDKTRLTITQGSFKEDKERFEQSNKGWHFVLEGLKKLVETN
jgi:uncharacterized protein YndB with AHSA1/START domain